MWKVAAVMQAACRPSHRCRRCDPRKGKHQRLLRLLWYWAVPIPVKGGGLEMIGVNVLLIVLPSLSVIVADLLLALTGRLCRLRLPVRRRLQL